MSPVAKSLKALLLLGLFMGTACSPAKQESNAALLKRPSSQYTPKSKAEQPVPEKAKLIVIDAGHGGKDMGTINSKLGLVEKNLSLKTTLKLKKRLTELGYKVALTRSRDQYLPLDRRVKVANQRGADAFVSVHFNSASNKKAEGIEVFYYDSPKAPRKTMLSRHLAKEVLRSSVSHLKTPSRGVKIGAFRVIRSTQMPAVLVEGGFVTNDREGMRLRDDAYIDRLAKSIAVGLDQFFVSSYPTLVLESKASFKKNNKNKVTAKKVIPTTKKQKKS